MRFRRPVPVRFVVAGVLLLLVQWWFIGLTLMREGGSPMREGGSLMWEGGSLQGPERSVPVPVPRCTMHNQVGMGTCTL